MSPDHGADLSLLFAKRGPDDLKKRIFDRVAADPWMFKGPLPGYSEDYIGLPFAGEHTGEFGLRALVGRGEDSPDHFR